MSLCPVRLPGWGLALALGALQLALQPAQIGMASSGARAGSGRELADTLQSTRSQRES